MAVSATRGQIGVEGVASRSLGALAEEIHVDLEAKHAEICGVSDREVILWATSKTLHASKDKDGTVVDFTMPEGWWIIMAEVNRYTLRVICGKMPELEDWAMTEVTTHRTLKALLKTTGQA